VKRRSSLVIAGALVALTALLVGFQGASMLVTVAQLGASAPKPQPAKSHASLVPQTPLAAVKPNEPAPAPKVSAPVSEPVPAPTASEQVPVQTVTDNQAGVAAAAKAKAQAEMDTMGPTPDESALPQEPRRRYRAPRPELHRVY
jgi:hypothetical protein